MALWLPYAYTVNQLALIMLGIWAVVDRQNVIQIELVDKYRGKNNLFK